MKLQANLFLPALALPLLLAACGSASTGNATVRLTDVRTEYKTPGGIYVACDTTNLQGGGSTNNTAVGVYYTISGTFSTLELNLLGDTPSNLDSNFYAKLNRNDLNTVAGNDFKTVFFADSTTAGGLLPNSLKPQAIVVKPNADVSVKTVNTGNSLGKFYTNVTLDGSVSTNSRSALVRDIPVYDTCTVTGVTSEKL
jgi:hypothetical protein